MIKENQFFTKGTSLVGIIKYEVMTVDFNIRNKGK